MEKFCRWCSTVKPLSEFYRHSKMADGHLNKCKRCVDEYISAWRASPEGGAKRRAADRRRVKTPKEQQNDRNQTRRRRLLHPEQHRAHERVRHAIKTGRLVPWPKCCVPTCNESPEAHHYDYSKPLEVIWVCPLHHAEIHKISQPTD